ncbi:MAG: hypothetical protein ABIK09_03665 [Pseudomonadota bacterium]
MKIVAIIIVAALAGCGGGGAPAATPEDTTTDTAGEIFLVVDSPEEGTWSASPLLLVTGRLLGADGGTVTLGDVHTPVIDGFFSLWVPLEQGENVLALSHDPTGASATLTVSLDALPPLLDMETPARGQVFPDGGSLEVRFSASDEEGLAAVRVQDTDLAPGGPYTALIHPAPGLQHVVVEAEDTLGNLAREHRSILVGPLVPCADLAKAPALSLGMGADVLDLAAAEVADRLAVLEVADLLDAYNPIYESGSLVFNLTDVTLTGLGLDLTPAQGSLDLVVAMEEITAYGTVAAGGTELDLILSLTEVSVAGSVHVLVPEPGLLDVATEDLELTSGSLEITALDANGEEVVAPTQVSGAILDFVGSFVADMVEAQSADLLAGAAGYGEGSIPLDLFGEPVLVEYHVLDAIIQPTGLRLDMAGAFTLVGEAVHPWNYDCPGHVAPIPDVPPGGGLHIWVSYPFLDRILLGLWTRGFMDFTIDQAFVDSFKAEVTLVCGMLGTLMELGSLEANAEAPMEISLAALLPPLMAPSTILETGVALDIGDLTMDFSCAGQAAPQARVHLSLAATLGFEVTGSRLTPTLEFGDLLLDVSGIPATDKRRVEGGIEVALEGVFTELLPSLSEALSPVDLPQMMGYQITQGIAGNDPATNWFQVHALVAGGTE